MIETFIDIERQQQLGACMFRNSGTVPDGVSAVSTVLCSLYQAWRTKLFSCFMSCCMYMYMYIYMYSGKREAQ